MSDWMFVLIGFVVGMVMGGLIYWFAYWSMKRQGQERRKDYSMCLDCRDGFPQWCPSFPNETCFERVQRLKRETQQQKEGDDDATAE